MKIGNFQRFGKQSFPKLLKNKKGVEKPGVFQKRGISLVLIVMLFVIGCSNQGGNTMTKTAVFETNKGTFEIELFTEKAPITTKNFIDLTEKGFYDGLIFHRVIKGFMIQGGDPDGRGTGGPGYTIEDEFHPDLKHDSEGILSMANSGPNTGGSQFFITLAATPWLDGKHAVFGKVTKGIDLVKEIGNTQTEAMDKPAEDIVINKITIK